MTIAFWCVLVAGIMPIVWAAFAKMGPGSDFKHYTNNQPRAYLSQVTGMAQRANWAQQNAWEAFAPFAAAIIIASFVGLTQGWIDRLALIFIVARTIYGVAYILDQAYLRSLMWFVGFVCIVSLYIMAAVMVS